MECGHWGALPADALRHMYGLLPDAVSLAHAFPAPFFATPAHPLPARALQVSRAACRLVCTHWNQVADDSWQCWQFLTVRSKPAKRGALACLGIFPPTPEQLASLLSRQRPHLRRLQLEQGAVGGAGIEAAEALAPALVAACGPGSGITDLTLTVQLPLPTCVLEVRPRIARPPGP